VESKANQIAFLTEEIADLKRQSKRTTKFLSRVLLRRAAKLQAKVHALEYESMAFARAQDDLDLGAV